MDKIKCNGIRPLKSDVYMIMAELVDQEDILTLEELIRRAINFYDMNYSYRYYYDYYEYYTSTILDYYGTPDNRFIMHANKEEIILTLLFMVEITKESEKV